MSHVQACWDALRHIEQYSSIIGVYSERFRTLCKPCIYNCAILRTQAHLKPEVSSKVCKTCKMIRHIRSPGTVRTFYSSSFKGMIFRDINLYSATLRCSTKEKGEASAALFWKSKKVPDFGKKNTDSIYCWVKFSIQNAVLRVWEKTQKGFQFFPCVFDKMFLEVP